MTDGHRETMTPRSAGRLDNPRLAFDTWDLAEQFGLLDRPCVVPYNFVPWRRAVARLTGEEFARLFRKQLDAALIDAPEVPLAFYFHVPFCTHFCSYCRCYRRTLTALHGRLEQYTEFILAQLDFFAPWLGDVEAKFWSMGGGTPSVLQPTQLARIFERFHRRYKVARDNPVPTFEMSLPSVTPELAEVVADCGFRRASIGIQTMNPQVRAAHTMAEIDERMLRDAVETLTAHKLFVNLDFIVGLPGESAESFLRGFEIAMATRPASCVVNVLQSDGAERGDPTVRATYVRAIAPRMLEIAADYEVLPHGREIESLLFFGSEFAEAIRPHRGTFARLASGVRAVSIGTSTFAFGTQCESAAAPDYLFTNVDVHETTPDRSEYFLNYKGLYETLKYRSMLNGLDDDDVRLLNGLALALPEQFAGIETDFHTRGLRLRFADPEQADGHGEVCLDVEPSQRAYLQVGRFGISYGHQLSTRGRAVMRAVAAHCRGGP